MSSRPQIRLPFASQKGASGGRDFFESIDRFAAFGSPTRRERRGGVDYLYNEFWTSRQRRSHRLHEISYRACFKAELPDFFITRLTSPGDVVYDPFMGRGTTLLQAALRGRIPWGNDVNPLSAMLIAPRLSPPSLSQVMRRLSEIDFRAAAANDSCDPSDVGNVDLEPFYHPATLKELRALRRHLLDKERGKSLDVADLWIRMVALNRLTGHSSGFFSAYTLPPNQAASSDSQRRINARRGVDIPPRRDVAALIGKKISRSSCKER